MTPKTRKLLCIGVPLAALVVVVVVLARTFLLTHPPAGPVVLHCWDGEKAIAVTLPDDEAQRVRSIFTGKLKYPESYACGFSSESSVEIGGRLYCLAWDGCTAVQFGESEDIAGTFISISQRDLDWLADLIEKHGGVYPPFQ